MMNEVEAIGELSVWLGALVVVGVVLTARIFAGLLAWHPGLSNGPDGRGPESRARGRADLAARASADGWRGRDATYAAFGAFNRAAEAWETLAKARRRKADREGPSAAASLFAPSRLRESSFLPDRSTSGLVALR